MDLGEYQRGYRAGHWEGLHEPRYPVSFTDEDVERVAEAIYAALEDSYSIERETTEAPTRDEKLDAARAALSAYLEPTTKGDT